MDVGEKCKKEKLRAGDKICTAFLTRSLRGHSPTDQLLNVISYCRRHSSAKDILLYLPSWHLLSVLLSSLTPLYC